MQQDNLTLLLQGNILIKELISNDKKFRTWIEIDLQPQVNPLLTFVDGGYMMVDRSNFANAYKKKTCEKSKAKFKVRYNSFLIDDIENGYDPCYDWVGEYEYIDSIDDLFSYLAKII